MKKYKLLPLSLAAAMLLTSCSLSGDTNISESTEQTEPAPPPQTTAETTLPETTVTEAATTEPVIDPALCAADIERFALSEGNKFLSEPVEFVIDEENDALSLDVTYEEYVDIYTLQNAIMDISVTDGSFTLNEDCINADGSINLTKAQYCMIEDGEGNRKKYTLTLERQVCELPIVNIYLNDETDISSIALNQYSPMEIYIDNSGAPEYSGTVVMPAQIKGRGHSTWKWEKKPFRIKLDYSAPILGLHKNRDWILLANYSDRSLIRNTVAYEMGKCLDSFDWTPTQIPVDLFVNGEYRGVYSMGEHMETANGRVEIDENHEETDTGYLLEVGGNDPDMVKGVDFFHADSQNVNYVVFRAPEDITDEQRRYIVDYVNEADRAIMAGTGYEEYIDVDSFCDWIIMHELTRNIDSCFWRSCFITKDKGGKLKMGPIWDFDLAFGNIASDNPDYQRWVSIGTDAEDAYIWVNWCNYLLYNDKFREQLRSRWFEVKDELMDTAMKCIDYYAAKLDKSQEENFKVWQIMGVKVGFSSNQSTAADTYELQIQYLKDFLIARAEWISEKV